MQGYRITEESDKESLMHIERVTNSGVKIYAQTALAGLRRAGRLAAELLDDIAPRVVAGVSTGDLNLILHRSMVARGAVPATLGYKGYAKSSCISVNHEVCHGIPSERRILHDGDILNIDVTVILDGWYGDTSRMFAVGTPSPRGQRLMAVTAECLRRGLFAARAGNTLGDVGYAIEAYALFHRCGVVREFTGHGIGRVFHDAPSIFHHGRPGEGMVLEPGMVFTIEPMINAGREDVKLLADGWTVVTRDHAPSAQYEHMIMVTDSEPEIFTLSQNAVAWEPPQSSLSDVRYPPPVWRDQSQWESAEKRVGYP